MNNRYLYRGKSLIREGNNIAVGDWIYGAYTDKCRAGGNSFSQNKDGTHYGIYLSDENGARFIPVDKSTVGQCTGFRDANGTLVYEGDIIKSEGLRYEIEWVQKYSAFKAVKKGTKFKDAYNYSDEYYNLKDLYNVLIIGNIHDVT